MLRIDGARLQQRLDDLGRVGAIEGGGVCRLALTDEDRAGRDLVTGWMRDLGLHVAIDPAGNVTGVRPGREGGPPVLTGSHIDTVATGGRYDGALGVLAGLEVVEALNDAGVETGAPLAVAFFSNEEGVRFQPDAMGSMIQQGHLPPGCMTEARDPEGRTYLAELERIGYRGETPFEAFRPRAFVELHIEQGPVLERERVTIGAVESVQGLLWLEVEFRGEANHAGTTPMSLRHDAGYAAGCLTAFVRQLAGEIGGHQVATVGSIRLKPDLANVVPKQANVTIDMRNTDDAALRHAAERIDAFAAEVAREEGLAFDVRRLSEHSPVSFDPRVVAIIDEAATSRGYPVKRMPSGASHDAQAFAPGCPTAMIFVPSVGGISHNVREFTETADIEAGTNVLLDTMVRLAEEDIQ